MSISPSSYAAAVGSGVSNENFSVSAQTLKRKILITGTGDPAKEPGIELNTPILVTSPEDVGAKTGFGFMLHRLAEQSYKGSKGIETWIIVQEEDSEGVQAVGSIDFTGSSGVKAGPMALYIAGIMNRPVNVSISDDMTPEAIANAVISAISDIKELPVTAKANTTAGVVDVTSKSKGAWGNKISITFNLNGEKLPIGVQAVVTDMTGGTSTDNILDALNGLGTDDLANDMHITDLTQGYGQDTVQLNHVANYVGQGNDFSGLYSKLVHKPLRSLNGDTAPKADGLAALVSLGDGRKLDRANGTIAVPGSASHPDEIAAQAMGHMARINNIRAEENYVDVLFIDIDPGNTVDRWTSKYTNRETAVKAGISPTFVKNGKVVMQNVLTYYHPDSIPEESNGYRSMRNISILQNILDSQYKTFNSAKWKGITIVKDATTVGDTNAREKVKDIDAVIDEAVGLIKAWNKKAWLYETAFSIEQLKKIDAVSIRSGTTGFDVNIEVLLSGEGLIINAITKFDTSIAVLG